MYREAYSEIGVPALCWSDGDEMGRTAEAPRYLINKLLEVDSHGLLAGGSMAFKTFLDLRMAFSVCTGADFFGHQVFQTGKVLYLCGEGKGALARRIKALHLTEGDFGGNLLVLDNAIRIDNQMDMAMLRAEIVRINPVLTLFDTFGSLVGETDENSNSEVGAVLRLVKETCRHNDNCSLIVHHYGKDAARGTRGAVSFKSNVDFELALVREEHSMRTTLSCLKMKDGELFDDLLLEAEVIDLHLEKQDGETATSLVLRKSDTPFKSLLSPRQERLLEFIRGAIEDTGISIELNEWRREMYDACGLNGRQSRVQLSRDLDRLVETKNISISNGYIELYK